MKIQVRLPYLALLLVLFSFRSSQEERPSLRKDNRLLATAWYALSAEKQACYLQTYRLAGQQLETMRKQKPKAGKKWAIVTDLDETLLDNSAWSVRVLMEGKDYPDYWNDWEKAGKAPAFPGAVDFYKKVSQHKIPVYYVSNRAAKNLDATISNLKKLGLPYADSSHILLKTKSSNKIERREEVLKKHEILMLLGDNLADFDGVWEDAKPGDRSKSVSDNKTKWGNRFIIFPNPMYGGWRDALFSYKRGMSEVQQDSVWSLHLTDFLKASDF
jgi:5'-nucleotidase (lipoprotein e(P4) family)